MNVSHFFIEMYQLYYIFIFSIKHIYCCFVSGMHSKFEVNNPSIFEFLLGPVFQVFLTIQEITLPVEKLLGSIITQYV